MENVIFMDLRSLDVFFLYEYVCGLGHYLNCLWGEERHDPIHLATNGLCGLQL